MLSKCSSKRFFWPLVGLQACAFPVSAWYGTFSFNYTVAFCSAPLRKAINFIVNDALDIVQQPATSAPPQNTLELQTFVFRWAKIKSAKIIQSQSRIRWCEKCELGECSAKAFLPQLFGRQSLCCFVCIFPESGERGAGKKKTKVARSEGDKRLCGPDKTSSWERATSRLVSTVVKYDIKYDVKSVKSGTGHKYGSR